MTTEAKIISGIGIFTVIIIIFGLMFAGNGGPKTEVAVNKEVLTTSENPRITGKNPKIQIVEFGDFQCPACAMLSFNMKELFKTHGDSIDFVYRVIPIHQYSYEAANAGYAAAEQGKFKEMYEKLFEKQDEWSAPKADRGTLFAGYAAELGLDVELFKKTIAEKAGLYKTIVDKDNKDAQTMGIQATPTLIINGTQVTRGAISYSQLKTIVDTELEKLQTTATTTK